MAKIKGTVRRLTQPATEPVTLAEARRQLRNEGESADDALINDYISSARQEAENICNRAWASADFVWTFGTLVYKSTESGWEFSVPFPYVTDISEIAYLDVDDVRQTVSNPDTRLNEKRQTITIPADTVGHEWEISFTAGPDLGTSNAEMLPSSVKSAILLFLTDMYENRAAQQEVKIEENMAAMRLLWPHRTNLGV